MSFSRAARSVVAAAMIALAAPWAVLAQQAPGPAPERIPFKQDEGEFGPLMWKSILVAAGLVVVALGAIYAMRRYGMMPMAMRSPVAGGARVLQTLRLGPRASLFVVQFEGRRVLIGQTDRGLTLIKSVAADPARGPGEGG